MIEFVIVAASAVSAALIYLVATSPRKIGWSDRIAFGGAVGYLAHCGGTAIEGGAWTLSHFIVPAVVWAVALLLRLCARRLEPNPYDIWSEY